MSSEAGSSPTTGSEDARGRGAASARVGRFAPFDLLERGPEAARCAGYRSGLPGLRHRCFWSGISVLESPVKGYPRVSYLREELAMCSGDRLVADFVAGTDARPGLPGELEEHLTATADGLWVVWAYKLARQAGDLFVPLTGGSGYPADARAECRFRGARGAHGAPDPGCTCGFHALSSRRLPGLPVRRGGFTALTVALSGRVLAFEWAGRGVLWRAERQTVVRIERPTRFNRMEEVPGERRHPDDPDGRLAVVRAVTPRDSGPVRLNLPVSSPVLLVCHDDAGWCAGSSMFEHSPASLVLA